MHVLDCGGVELPQFLEGRVHDWLRSTFKLHMLVAGDGGRREEKDVRESVTERGAVHVLLAVSHGD